MHDHENIAAAHPVAAFCYCALSAGQKPKQVFSGLFFGEESEREHKKGESREGRGF